MNPTEDRPGELARRRYLFVGRVQGVGFRAFTASRARWIGVAGFVRNRPDGTVEAIAEGTPDQVARFEAECRRGPPLAHVTDVTIVDEPPTGERGFDVKR